MAHLQKFIDRFKAKASKAKQAQSRVKALARMEKLAPVLTSADFQFEFREPQSLPNPMLAFSVVACGYPAASRRGRRTAARSDAPEDAPARARSASSTASTARCSPASASASSAPTARASRRWSRRSLATCAPLAGEIIEGKGLTIGYFAQQELDVLSPADGPLMHMVRLARDVGPPAREQELRDFLGSFRFIGEMVTQPVGTLSGGEKARLVLAMLVWQRPNLLLLDEPTNHLDLTTREALSMALNEFEGTVMLVSHDRALLREVCDEFWLVTGGAVKPFDGDLDDYQRWLLEQSRGSGEGESRAGPGARPPRAPRPRPPAGTRHVDAAAKPLRRSSSRSTTASACCSPSATASKRPSRATPPTLPR